MKLDKETLSKHRFWVIFGLMVPLLLLCMLWLTTAVADTNQLQKRRLLAHKDALDRTARDDLKGVEYTKVLTKRTADLEKQRLDLWEQAWDMQKSLITWPKEVEDSIGKLDFGAEIHPNDASRYARNTVYPPQFRELGEKSFRSTIQVGEENVQMESVRFLRGWDNVLVFVKEDPWKRAPSSMEVWLAQEDYWVQSELIRAIQEANQTVARFQKVDKNPDDPEGKPYPVDLAPSERFRAHFINPYWHLDLIMAERGAQHVLKGTIQNRPHTRRQMPIGRLFFNVQLNQDGKPVVLPIEGETLAPGGEWPIKEFPLPGLIIPEDLLSVTQIFDVRDAPIRQINEIRIAAVSHRLFNNNRPLLPMARGTDAAAPSPLPAKGQPAASSGLTQNGLVRDRYADVSKEVRRLPFCLVVLADQAHVPEILTAIANCRLRAQVTQVAWQHYRGSISVDPATRPKGKGPAITEIPQTNTVELVIYGVASMYERYKPHQETVAKDAKAQDAKDEKAKDMDAKDMPAKQ